MVNPDVNLRASMVNPPAVSPILEGHAYDRHFVLAVSDEGYDLFVLIDGWMAVYDIEEMLKEIYEDIWGPYIEVEEE